MKTSSKNALQVVLGSQTIKAFVAAPKEFKVLGIVRMGLEFGLLATTASGDYVRVNGSQVQALNTEAVEEAIHFARSHGRGESYASSRNNNTASSATHSVYNTPSTVPTVIVRKRRRLDTNNFHPMNTAVNAPLHAVAA